MQIKFARRAVALGVIVSAACAAVFANAQTIETPPSDGQSVIIDLVLQPNTPLALQNGAHAHYARRADDRLFFSVSVVGEPDQNMTLSLVKPMTVFTSIGTCVLWLQAIQNDTAKILLSCDQIRA